MLIIASCCSFLGACQSFQLETRPVPLTDSTSFKQTIQVQTLQGNTWTLTHAHVLNGRLIGTTGTAEVSIPVSDVRQVKVLRYDGKKTWETIGFIGDVLGGVADAIPSGRH
jgi:hypothetical protein